MKKSYIQAHNFSKEIVLQFNLGPQHMLEDLVAKVYSIFKAMKKDFFVHEGWKGKASHLVKGACL